MIVVLQYAYKDGCEFRRDGRVIGEFEGESGRLQEFCFAPVERALVGRDDGTLAGAQQAAHVLGVFLAQCQQPVRYIIEGYKTNCEV